MCNCFIDSIIIWSYNLLLIIIIIAKFAKIYLVADNECKSESGGGSIENSVSERSLSQKRNISGVYKLVPTQPTKLSNYRNSRIRNKSSLAANLERNDRSMRIDSDKTSKYYPFSPNSRGSPPVNPVQQSIPE